MNEVTIIDPAKAEIPAPVANYVEVNPTSVLLDENLWERFLGEIKVEVASHVPDLKTDKGRKAIAALAAKVSRTKTAIDAAGLELTKEWRERTNTVNAARSVVKTQLDELRDLARKPLTDWEEAEKERYRRCDAAIAFLEKAAIITVDDTPETVGDRLANVLSTVVEASEFSELFDRAAAAKKQAAEALDQALVRLQRQAEERAELDRLRAEAAERQRQEEERLAAERAAAEEAARLQREAEEAAAAEARRREEAERLAAEMVERAQRDAEEQRQAAEQQRIAAEKAEEARLAAVAAAEQKAVEAAAAARRQAEEEAARRQEAAAAEAYRRAQDVANKGRVMGEAKTALMEAGGVDEETARKIVLAIVKGTIPHVSIQF